MTQDSVKSQQFLYREALAIYPAMQLDLREREQELLASVPDDSNEYRVFHFMGAPSQLVQVKEGGWYGSGSVPLEPDYSI